MTEASENLNRENAMAVWLITGASGFLGRHLINILQQEDRSGLQIVQCGRNRPHACSAQDFRAVDLTQSVSIRNLLQEVHPDVVIHLAGKTPPGSPEEFFAGNTVPISLLLDILHEQGRPVRVVQAGSAAELGMVPVEELPVSEDYPCQPVNAYGMSKWLGTLAGIIARSPIEVMSARVFNPVGPGIAETQALGSFARRLVSPATTRMDVQDLDVRRDFVDVRDVARALIALADHGQAKTVYHVGTGDSHTIREGLEYMIARCGRKVEVKVSDDLAFRPKLVDSRADISRIIKDTGWRPEIPWEQSLSDLWEAELARHRLPLTA